VQYLSIKEQKIERIQKIFTPLLGETIERYGFVELLDEDDGEWEAWHEIPLRLDIGKTTLCISWEKFEDLALAQQDDTDQHWDDDVMRWRYEGIEALDTALHNKIVAVALATYEESAFWSRLLIYLQSGAVLDIYNALDENAYALYTKDTIKGALIEVCSL